MVNPYEPTHVSHEEGDRAATSVSHAAIKKPGFLGGLKTVLLVGAISGAAIFGWGFVGGNLSGNLIVPLLGWAVLFFAMNFALMYFLRGLELSSPTRLGCAALLTPVSMILFVPVCFGAVVSMATVQSVLPRSIRYSNGFGMTLMLVVTVVGFVIIAAVVAVMVRSWATTRLSRQSNAAFQAETKSSS